jgi:hypothetical protein
MVTAEPLVSAEKLLNKSVIFLHHALQVNLADALCCSPGNNKKIPDIPSAGLLRSDQEKLNSTNQIQTSE